MRRDSRCGEEEQGQARARPLLLECPLLCTPTRFRHPSPHPHSPGQHPSPPTPGQLDGGHPHEGAAWPPSRRPQPAARSRPCTRNVFLRNLTAFEEPNRTETKTRGPARSSLHAPVVPRISGADVCKAQLSLSAGRAHRYWGASAGGRSGLPFPVSDGLLKQTKRSGASDDLGHGRAVAPRGFPFESRGLGRGTVRTVGRLTAPLPVLWPTPRCPLHRHPNGTLRNPVQTRSPAEDAVGTLDATQGPLQLVPREPCSLGSHGCHQALCTPLASPCPRAQGPH